MDIDIDTDSIEMMNKQNAIKKCPEKKKPFKKAFFNSRSIYHHLYIYSYIGQTSCSYLLCIFKRYWFIKYKEKFGSFFFVIT